MIPITDLERKLMTPFPLYALEQLRARFMYATTTTHDTAKSARVVSQMAFETEIGAAIGKLISITSDVAADLIVERRRYLEIDIDMQRFSFLFGPALNTMREAAVLPDTYVQLLQTYLASHYAQYRTCATAALLVVSAEVLVDG